VWVIDNQDYLGKLDGWNRSAQFADGLFETMRIHDGKILGLPQHVARLSNDLARLNIQPPAADLSDLLSSYAHTMTDMSHVADGVMKVIISRGDSERGYGYHDEIKPHITVFYNQAAQLPDSVYTKGVDVVLLQTQCAIQPQLAGIKHLNRLENVLAKKELGTQAFEGLMQNHLGFIIEGAMSNVFFEHQGQLITPELTLSGVAGVMRQHVLAFADKLGVKIEIRDISIDELAGFEHGFLSNSVMGIVPVKSLMQRDVKIGKLTMQLLKAWQSGVIYE